MNQGTVVHILLTVIVLVALYIFVPREKIRVAFLAFLICQLFSWPMSISSSLFELREHPFRLFPDATSGSFIQDYLLIPSVFSLFQIHYPECKNRLYQLFYYFFFVSTATLLDVLIEKYTDLITYTHWAWYWSFLVFFAKYFISRQYMLWFLKKADHYRL